MQDIAYENIPLLTAYIIVRMYCVFVVFIVAVVLFVFIKERHPYRERGLLHGYAEAHMRFCGSRASIDRPCVVPGCSLSLLSQQKPLSAVLLGFMTHRSY